MTTPRPWPEGTYPPSSEIWLDWFLEQDRDDQLMLAAAILASQETAARCWNLNHDAENVHLQNIVAAVTQERETWRARAHRYRNAYRSARRSRRMWRGRAEVAVSDQATWATGDHGVIPIIIPDTQ